MYNWDIEAERLLKVELARKGISYKVLAGKLAAIGITDSESAIANKINRGRFKMVFFLQCMKAIGVETVSVAVQEELQ
jgi:3-mercaptopyruvate sulfurtransferase SseA